MLTVLIGIVAAATLAYGLLWYDQEQVTTWLDRILRFRRLIFQIGVVIFALAALSSGYLPLMLVAVAIFTAGFIIAFTRYDLDDIRGWIGV